MSSSDAFIYADNRAIIFHSSQFDGSAPIYRNTSGSEFVKNDDVWVNLDSGSMRLYSSGAWQAVKIAGNTIDGTYPEEASLKIVDTNTNAAYQKPSLVFGGHTTDLFTVKAVNGSLDFFKLGSLVLRLNSSGNVEIPGNLTVTGDLFADDVGYDEALINILKVEDRIEHNGNATNKITFETDKVTIDASGTSIVLDDTAMTDQIVITGQTKFINNIHDVPDIYVQNHIHHHGDANTRMGFPANDQIALRTNGVDRVFVTTTGNVGIGTTAPVEQFQVGESSSAISLGGTPVNNGTGRLKFLNSNAVNNWQISTNDTVSGAFEIIPSTVAGGSTFTSPSFLIASNGNVGLATSSPAYALDVNGTARFTAFRDNANSLGTAGQVLSSTGSGLSWIAAGGSLPCSVLKETKTSGTASAVAFPVNTSTQKRQLNVTANSNLAVTVSGSPNWTFTIPTAGTYLFKGRAFFRSNVVDSQTLSSLLVLNNNTLGLGAVIVGDSAKYGGIHSSNSAQNFVAHMDGIYTISGTTVFTLDHVVNTPFQTASGGISNGLLGYEETYASLVITKLA